MFSFLGDSSVFKHYDFIAVFEVLQLMGDEQDSFFSQFLFDAFEEYVFSNMSVNGGERIVQKNYVSITVNGPATKKLVWIVIILVKWVLKCLFGKWASKCSHAVSWLPWDYLHKARGMWIQPVQRDVKEFVKNSKIQHIGPQPFQVED